MPECLCCKLILIFLLRKVFSLISSVMCSHIDQEMQYLVADHTQADAVRGSVRYIIDL